MDTPIRRNNMLLAAAAMKRYTAINESRLNEILDKPAVVVGGTVVKQDPPPGTNIPRGGSVVLTIARTRDFPMNIIEGAHIEFDKYKIGDVYDDLTKNNPHAVLDIFDEVEDYAALNEAQKQQVDGALGRLGIPGSAAGYRGAQGALSLGGIG